MPTDIPGIILQFGFAGLLLFYVVPEIRRLGRSIDRLAMAHLIQLSESEILGEKMKQRAKNLASEINTGKEDLS